MKQLQFSVDYEFCPKGHTWVFIPASNLYSDIFWCGTCEKFYYPSVKSMPKEKLNEMFASDRAGELIKRAEFIKWKNGLNVNDMKYFKELSTQPSQE